MYSLHTIEHKLTTLRPSLLKITDDSEKHQGHAGYKSGFLSHVRIQITSARFSGMTRLEIHRMIHDLLKEELSQELHSIVIRANAPNYNE